MGYLMEGAMRILDATASNRSMWYQKDNPFTVFFDKRCRKEYTQTENSNLHNKRIIRVFPDVVGVWQHLPFINESFDMVVFDPPHILKEQGTKLPLMAMRYGVLYKHNWKQEIEDGIKELFRVLKPEGVFIFKWNESDIEVSELLKIFPYIPMFGTRTGQKNATHWITFLKHRHNYELESFS